MAVPTFLIFLHHLFHGPPNSAKLWQWNGRTVAPGKLAIEEVPVRIKLNSVLVDDQSKALRFYTEVLGFIKSHEIPVGEFRWLTVRSPEGGDTELALEPNVNPAAKTYQAALFEQGIPLTAFEVGDIQAEYRRLKALGVAFTVTPTQAGPVWVAVFADTCGNLIQIYQPAGS